MAVYNKQRYYWIKITDKFMTSDTVDFLMEQKDGANYKQQWETCENVRRSYNSLQRRKDTARFKMVFN